MLKLSAYPLKTERILYKIYASEKKKLFWHIFKKRFGFALGRGLNTSISLPNFSIATSQQAGVEYSHIYDQNYKHLLWHI